MKPNPSPRSLTPTGLVLLSIVSVQLGSALAKHLFSVVNPAGVVLLRVGFAAIILLALWRPEIRNPLQVHARSLLLFGCSLALMNLSFYLAIERIPLGIAVTLEFVGPLGIAVVNSRQWLDLLWVLLATIGILLLAPIGETVFEPTGIALALFAGSCWAAYILLSVEVGRAVSGGAGLALAMTIAAIILLPIGIFTTGTALLQPKGLLLGLGVALLSSAIPYSLELEALRNMPVQVFGVLLSLEPAVAAIAGFIVLGEVLNLRAMMAIGLVTIAATGASKFNKHLL